jgi:pSer/pThr/pTyr-binding forkhead associated (FHA) protein
MFNPKPAPPASGGEPAAGAAPAAAAPGPDAPREVFATFVLSPMLSGPVELEAGKCYRVGRDRANDVCFPSGHVSRIHSEIVVEKGQWTIGDLGSRNGTFVNGERVLKRPLKDGDKIGVGEFELTFREATKEETFDLLSRPNRSIGEDTARVEISRDGFYGDVQKVSVVELAQLLGQNRKTGCLTIIEKPGAERRLFFADGSIVHAESGAEDGEVAAAAILRAREGKFTFKPSPSVARVTITTPTPALLFNAASS